MYWSVTAGDAPPRAGQVPALRQGIGAELEFLDAPLDPEGDGRAAPWPTGCASHTLTEVGIHLESDQALRRYPFEKLGCGEVVERGLA